MTAEMDPTLYETSDDIDTHSIIALHTLHEELPEDTWRIFRVLHIILTTIALLGNCILLLVVYGLVSRLTPPIQLVTNISFANMLASWAVVTMYFPHTSCQEEIQTGLMMSAHNAAALTLMAYVVVYYIAIFRPLEYDSIVTRKRVWIALLVIWIVALFSAHSHFLVTVATHHHESLFCFQVFDNTFIGLSACIGIAGITLLVSSFVITRSMLYLRPLEAFTDPNQTVVEPRKSTHQTNTIIISLILYVCTWIPYLVAAFAHSGVHNTQEGFEAAVAMFSFMSFVQLYCVACPVIFALRLDTIMNGYDKLYMKIRSWIRNSWERLSTGLQREEQSTSPLNPIESVF